MAALAGFLIIVLALGAYFLPTLVAAHRHTSNQGGVLVLNFFLGWTVLGWVIALACAAGGRVDVRHVRKEAWKSHTREADKRNREHWKEYQRGWKAAAKAGRELPTQDR